MVRITKRVRELAEELGVDVAEIKKGSGKDGAVLVGDVRGIAVAKPSKKKERRKTAVAVGSPAIRDGVVLFKIVGSAVVGEFRSGPYLRSRDYGKIVSVPEGGLIVEVPLEDGDLTESGNLTPQGLERCLERQITAVITPLSKLVRELEPESFPDTEGLPLKKKEPAEEGIPAPSIEEEPSPEEETAGGLSFG